MRFVCTQVALLSVLSFIELALLFSRAFFINKSKSYEKSLKRVGQ
jgi:hypothetical protein